MEAERRTLGQDDAAIAFAHQLGERLRQVRQSRHLSLTAVAERSGHEFKPSSLGAYERGERTISVLRLQQLARLYRVPVDQFLPTEDEDLVLDLRDGTELEGGADAGLVSSYVEAIRRQRRQEPGSLRVRRTDVVTLAAMLRCSPEVVLSQLS
jgi:transcriptional regulator with XRE-family HTH domain